MKAHHSIFSRQMFEFLAITACVLLLVLASPVSAQKIPDYDFFKQLIQQKNGLTGVYVLEQGEESLISRAWLADNARESIEVQYFIWSSDNIGILATEALLRAAERGVRVRVIVDDLLIDAPDETLLALSRHPNISIKIYNPKHSVGTPLHKRVFNLITNFRSFNQRMHDKTFIVDGIAAITGGRNMADEYYDFDHEYNFRDRDVLLLGKAAGDIRASFERFWEHPISENVKSLYDGLGIMQKNVSINSKEIRAIYSELHSYAKNEENYAPEIRLAVQSIPEYFPELLNTLVWTKVDIINDLPGKNDARFTLSGGGRSTQALAKLINTAEKEVLIQSPYLILTDEAKTLFNNLIQQGVSIKISTNSMSSTDNLPAFSGYRNQRRELLDMGIEIYEYKDEPQVRKTLMQGSTGERENTPVFALHAKTLVIDSKVTYIGTFNLDPRSINLNTETGAVIHDEKIAQQVAEQILIDMLPQNSWDASKERPDRENSFWKRSKTLMWQFMPIEPLL